MISNEMNTNLSESDLNELIFDINGKKKEEKIKNKDIEELQVEKKDDEQYYRDKKISLTLFILGFFLWFPFLINLRYIRSSNSFCKSLAIASIIAAAISIIILAPIIGLLLFALIDAKKI